LTLNLAQCASFLQAAITARDAILLTGAPGIGKSDLVSQAADRAGAKLILSHPAVADPTDVKGFPWVVDGKATFLPFGDLHQALHATEPTVWFHDDLGQASPAVQASYMQLYLARRVNGHVLPDCVSFIAATNRRIDRAGVSGVLEPVKSRFVSIVELQPDLASWCSWALTHGVPAEVIAFLRFKPEYLSAFKATADLTNSPSPRTWAHAGRLLGYGLPADILHVALAGAVGAEVATEFVAFLRMYQTLPSVDAILANQFSASIHGLPISTLHALSCALAYRATPANFAAIVSFCDRLHAAHHAEFAVLTVRDALARHPELAETTAYVQLTCGWYGQTVSGVR
jgi:AAA domain (dynein-related subfamily)